jgi:hypothetical protein
LADIYWLRSVQYYGAEHAFAADAEYTLLEPLINIAVELDPNMEIAYRYGAIFLCEPKPNGKGDAPAGIALLERGARALPNSWRLRQDLGYYSFLFANDAHRGAEVLLEASKIPGAPFWLENLAARILGQGGDRAASREIWRRMYEDFDAKYVKDNARYHLERLDALDGVDAWTALVKEHRAKTGRWPNSLEELPHGGLSLKDPAGVPYRYNRDTGQVMIARESRLWRSSV